jgi:phage FluMu protein Com
MATRKIKEFDTWNSAICRDRQHNPPGMRVYEPGLWEHECPSCGQITSFVIKPLYWNEMPGKIYKSAKDTIHKYRVRWGM